jgi:hypothetical protein
MKKKIVIFLLLLSGLVCFQALAQESTNFKQKEHVFNEGGNPDGGVILTSTNFKVTIDAVGEGLLGTALSSTSFKMDSGFIAPYPPPGRDIQPLP